MLILQAQSPALPLHFCVRASKKDRNKIRANRRGKKYTRQSSQQWANPITLASLDPFPLNHNSGWRWFLTWERFEQPLLSCLVENLNYLPTVLRGMRGLVKVGETARNCDCLFSWALFSKSAPFCLFCRGLRWVGMLMAAWSKRDVTRDFTHAFLRSCSIVASFCTLWKWKEQI